MHLLPNGELFIQRKVQLLPPPLNRLSAPAVSYPKVRKEPDNVEASHWHWRHDADSVNHLQVRTDSHITATAVTILRRPGMPITASK